MAALNRPTNATYETHENVTIDTQDNEDHTFCGIMFPIQCKDLLPIDHLVVKSVAVRGHLGPLTVWVSKTNANCKIDGSQRSYRRSSINTLSRNLHSREIEVVDRSTIDYRIPLDPSSWIKLYDNKHNPCPPGQYTELIFDEPVFLKPGEMRALYVHSTLPSDQAIVYDNSYYGTSDKRFEDDKICILTGRAHVSTTCFGQDPIWGYGNAWRDRREFVGRLAYGTVYKLWNPEVQPKFGSRFQDGARTLALCQRRWESPFSTLPDEAIFYILNMCRWDWFDDNINALKDRRRREKRRKEQEEQQKKSPTITAGCSTIQNNIHDVKSSEPVVNSGQCNYIQSLESSNVSVDGTNMYSVEREEEDHNEQYTYMSVETEGNEDLDTEEFETDDSSEDDDYHRANRGHFSFKYPSSDDEETGKSMHNLQRDDWFRHQFARVHVLRALASMEDQDISEF